MFLLPIGVSIMRSSLIIIFFNLESPLYLINKNKHEEAERVLRIIYEDSYVGEELKHIMQRNETSAHKSSSWTKLLSRRYALRLVVGLVIAFNSQFSGINAVTFFSQRLFEKYVGDTTTANYFNIGLGFANLISNIFSGKLVDIAGRKKIYLIGDFFCMLFLALMAILYQYGYLYPSLAMIYLYSISYCMSIGQLLFIIIPEILPEQGLGLIFACNWVFAFIIGLSYPKMIASSLDVPGTFGFYAACCFFGFLFVLLFFKETKGKTNYEISFLFKGNKNKSLLTEGNEKDHEAED
jgi:MFS family permease